MKLPWDVILIYKFGDGGESNDKELDKSVMAGYKDRGQKGTGGESKEVRGRCFQGKRKWMCDRLKYFQNKNVYKNFHWRSVIKMSIYSTGIEMVWGNRLRSY